MVLFISTLVIFLIALFYFAIALSLIIKRRCQCEEHEYELRKSFERRYNLSIGVLSYMEDDSSVEIMEFLKRARTGTSLQEEFGINKDFEVFLCSLTLPLSDEKELRMLSLDISRKIDAYNKTIDRFNSSISSFFVKPVSRMCHVMQMKRLG